MHSHYKAPLCHITSQALLRMVPVACKGIMHNQDYWANPSPLKKIIIKK